MNLWATGARRRDRGGGRRSGVGAAVHDSCPPTRATLVSTPVTVSGRRRRYRAAVYADPGQCQQNIDVFGNHFGWSRGDQCGSLVQMRFARG